MSFPRYERYKDSGVEWLGEMPEHWDVKFVKALATCNDEVLTDKTPADYEIEYVEISGVDALRGIFETTRVYFGVAPSRARRCVKDGDIIVSTVRTYLRAIAAVTKPPANMIVSTGFAVVRPRSVDSRFLGYLFCSEFLIAKVIAWSVGVSYPAINASDLMRFKGLVPPTPEQQAIAAFLDRETAKIDALIAEQQRLIELLKEKRQAIISHAVTKGLNTDTPMKDSGIEWLGEVPEHWETIRLGSIFLEANDQGAEELPILTVSIHNGVSDREFDEHEMDRKVTRSEDRTKYKAVKSGDLVYNMMRAWQGGFGAVAVEGQVSPAYVVARPLREICTEFVEQILRSPTAVEEMRRLSHGVTDFRLRLYWEEFKIIVIALPPVLEQQSIMDAVRSQTRRFDALTAEAQTAISFLQERRTALISAAVTGKIDVRGI